MGFLADAIDLSAPFLFGAALLATTAWQCHRQAATMSVAVEETAVTASDGQGE